ncbi:MAG: hypothetical protein II983_06125 [Firmicutes bacterium]|nr:hypothetical protein [Methanobrevibacter sp.]MBQ4505234.1 hypothetical protein [Bacillota bacterium]MBR0371645.1 hypothetical protein [Methanobrevibacter sp.]
MEQIINMILGQSNINLQAFGLNVQSAQTVQPVTVEVIQAKINLIKQLDSIPAAHQFVEDFQIETVNQLDSLMKMEAVIGVKPTTEQLNGINIKIDAIINELETSLKNKMLAKLNGLGLGALSGLVR